MLNLFPIQWLALLAYFILRTVTGFTLGTLAWRHLKAREELKNIINLPIFPFGKVATGLLIATEFLIAILLTLGLLTQLGALLLFALAVKMLIFRKRWVHKTIPGALSYVLLLGISLTLFITGAGILAFDLPI